MFSEQDEKIFLPTQRTSGSSTRFIIICLFSIIGLIAGRNYLCLNVPIV